MTFSVHGLGVNIFYADINEVPQAVSRGRLECGPTAAPSTPTAPSHPRAPGAISLRHDPPLRPLVPSDLPPGAQPCQDPSEKPAQRLTREQSSACTCALT